VLTIDEADDFIRTDGGYLEGSGQLHHAIQLEEELRRL
jgi:hypothetical protein